MYVFRAHCNCAVSGDNILTAISVAKECGIIEAGVPVVEVSAEEENNSNPPIIQFTCSGNLLTVSSCHATKCIPL